MRQANEWWRKSVVYQIYPKSFQDSNGDGIGDLKGITQRLPYLANLGIDIIWLSPCYQSPMDDGGYDISDYYKIDPIFGTNEDMEELIQQAKAFDIKILMDLVVNHTSDEHEWFQEALKNPKSKYRDFYIFKKGINGAPPNNWRSYFGGSAWEKVPSEDNVFYLHAFSKKQPDLNWENSAVREKMIEMIEWWLEKGLGGFRIDAILNLKKNFEFGDLPADGEDNLAFIGHWILNQPGIEEWLEEIDRRTFRKYNSFTVSESNVADELLEQFIGEKGVFRTTLDFSYTDIDVPETGEWYLTSNWTVQDFKEKLFHHQLSTQKIGWGVQYLENHDQPRSINKYIPANYRNETSKKMLATLFMLLRGTPFIYQGQEIGMENIKMNTMSDYEDIATIKMYQRGRLAGLSHEEAFAAMYRRSRDNARTPMQWTQTANAGFSTTAKTWLKLNENYKEINVATEEKDSNSVLTFYKKLIALRREEHPYQEVVLYGEFLPALCYQDPEIIAFYREYSEKEVLVLLNFSENKKEVPLDEKFNQILLTNYHDFKIGTTIQLEPFHSVVFAKRLDKGEEANENT